MVKKNKIQLALSLLTLIALGLYSYLHITGNAFILGLAISMTGSDIVGGSYIPVKDIIIPCEQLHALYPQFKELPSAFTHPLPVEGSEMYLRYVKYSKSTLDVGGSALPSTTKWAINAASNNPVCVKSLGHFFSDVAEITKKSS
jgi:hypothetical protein